MHDYAIEARKEEAELQGGSQVERDQANNDIVSPDEPKSPQTPGEFKSDFSPMDVDEEVRSPEEIAQEKDDLKLEKEC